MNLPTWHRSAPCRSHDPDLWFPASKEHGLEATRICRSCPLRIRCLTEAVERNEINGIWGGINLASQNGRRKARIELGMDAPRGRPKRAAA